MNHSYHVSMGRIKLSPMTEIESEYYRRLRNQDCVRERFFYSEIISRDQQKEWYKKYLDDNTDIMMAIYYNASFVGCVGLYCIDSGYSNAEIGRIIVDGHYSGKGIGAVAIQGICNIAKQLGLSMVYANIYITNMNSIISFQKAGFVNSGLKSDVVRMEKQLSGKG